MKDLNNLSEQDILIETFIYVQKFPYLVTPYKDWSNLLINGFGDSRAKHDLLYHLLRSKNIKVEKIKVMFDWKDLPLPEKILNILKESDTIWGHRALKVTSGSKSIILDATWDIELEKINFPITKNWDGNSNTNMVTNGKINIFSDEEFDSKIKKNINLNFNEMKLFAKELNKFLKESRN